MMIKEDKIDCIWINVDCVVNDPVDVKAGGSEYLGFDFCVVIEEKELYLDYIKEVLKECGVPLIKISYGKETKRKELKIWNKEDILEAIKEDASYLIQEAKRNYKKISR